MKNSILKIKENYKLILAVFSIGLVFGWIFFHTSADSNDTKQKNQVIDVHDHNAEENTIWTCSMHPQIKQDQAGNCPICGMELIPLAKVDASEEEGDPNVIVLSESAAKLADIQTARVKKEIPKKKTFLQGKIQADERNIAELTARFEGRIEKLYVNFTGQKVQKGEKLAQIYSPTLLTAQRELLEAIALKQSRPALYLAAKAKLKLWDLSDKQIQKIEEKGEPQSYFDILSPISGTIAKPYVALGDYIKLGMPLFKVIDLSHVWGMFDAYESDLAWLKIGDQVEYTVQAIPGKSYQGKVSFIDPFLDAQSRTAKVRVEIANKDQTLKPEMFLNGKIFSKAGKNNPEILIPKSAVLWTGKRAVVYVKSPHTENPSFSYREIVLGPETDNFYVVASGLMEGEEIATNGVFKIDAAAQLQGLSSMMNPEGGAGSTPHDMSKMDMGSNTKNSKEKKSTESTQIKGVKKQSASISPKFQSQLAQSLESYLKLKDAFVASDEKQVILEARKVLNSLNSIDMNLLDSQNHSLWMKLYKPLKDNLKGMIEMKGIKMKRMHFSSLSDAFTKVLDTFTIQTSTKLYQEFCPMAFDNKGAYWISADKDIKNPYFGKAMLSCGEVKRVFK
jgi:Cu(I)/Ag(I) efflux system membrane fusion protein